MSERSREGHSQEVVHQLDPQHWLSGLDLAGGIGDALASWPALAGSDPVQATGSEQPTLALSAGGLPSALFDDTDDSLDYADGVVTGQTNFTFYAVVSTATLVGGKSPVHQRTGANWTVAGGAVLDISKDEVGVGARGNYTALRVGATKMTVGPLFTMAGTVDISQPAESEIVAYLNGEDDGTSQTILSNNTVAIPSGIAEVGGGAARPLGERMSELAVFHTTHTAAEVALVSRILSWRANRI